MTYETKVMNEVIVEHRFQVGDTIVGRWGDRELDRDLEHTITGVLIRFGRPAYEFANGAWAHVDKTEAHFRLKQHDYKFPVGAKLYRYDPDNPSITVLGHTTQHGRPAYRVKHHHAERTYDAFDDLESGNRWKVYHEPTKSLADYTAIELIDELQRRFGHGR